jgi:uncharacterized protein with GYD domain
MPFFLHQWSYKDPSVRAMVTKPQNREEIVALAAEAFGGRLHGFFFCFGDYDALCITEFPDNRTAMACVMSVVGQGGLVCLKTTPLVTEAEARDAMRDAHDTVSRYTPPARVVEDGSTPDRERDEDLSRRAA